jgi:hypothetical protein
VCAVPSAIPPPIRFLTTSPIFTKRSMNDTPLQYAQEHGKGKGKVLPRTGNEGPEGEKRYSSTLSLTPVLDEGGWSTPRTGRFTPGKETRYPWDRKMVGLQGRSGQVRKMSTQPGFDPPTIQPVASSDF